MLAKQLLTALAVFFSLPGIAQSPQRFDVVISEIMADPSPVVGLPNAEYIEIRNVSATAVNLLGWRISDATGTATISTAFILQPDSSVVLCANSHVQAFTVYGRTIGVASFPSLDNDGELLTLRSLQNRIIHAVNYSIEWHRNVVKQEGGWSLEMIDPKNPCTGKENWTASTNNLGGTPGRINSVNGSNNDDTPPQLRKTYTIDSVTVVAVFNEPLDSMSAVNTSNYILTGFTVLSATPLPPLFQTVQLKLGTPIQPRTVFSLTVNRVTDCKGNPIGQYNQAKVGLPQAAAISDAVINEILFNPKAGADDYVEFYNRSNKIIDASALHLANRSSSGAAGSLRKLSEEPHYLFPGEYIVVTENSNNLAKSYLVKNAEAVLSLSSLPSFPDDKGTVVLLNGSGEVVDEVAYDKDWHFALINDPEGVSLERLYPEAPSQNKASWHSAAATAGYGTPTYLNSQFRKTETVNAMIEVSPPVFSPDNDGHDDIATIQYKVGESGYVANVSIFDAGGRLVRYLVKNDLLALKGFWKWDGLGERLNKLPVGTYIVYTEIFNLQGKKQSFKNTIVLARRLN